jgi:hypothetical protein
VAIYSCSVTTSNTTSGNAALELIALSTSDRIMLMEVVLTLVNGANSIFALGQPAVKGINPSISTSSAEDFAALPGTAAIALSWATGPTAPTQFFRRSQPTNAVGGTIGWTFSRGVVIPPTKSIVIWNVTTNDTTVAELTWDE